MGGSDNEDNYSKRVQYFVKYKLFVEKPHMINKRAFFCSLFIKLDNAVYAIGGNDSKATNLSACERFSLKEGVWRPISPMNEAKNGSSCIAFEQVRLIFVFGGNNQKLGSLSTIEKYDIDFDRWTLISIALSKPLYDMSLLHIGNDKVLIFGGHTDGHGPNRDVHVLDLSLECFKARFGHFTLSLPTSQDIMTQNKSHPSHSQEVTKTYFPTLFDSSTSKVLLALGYCDQPPTLHELDISKALSCCDGSRLFYDGYPSLRGRVQEG